VKNGTKFDSNLSVEFVHWGLFFGTHIWLVSNVLKPKILVMTCQQPLVKQARVECSNASWQEQSWMADCGKGCDCGTVHKIITKMFSYTKRCVMSRRFSWYQFGNKRPRTFSGNWQLVWWNHHCPRTWDKGFFTWDCLSLHIQIDRILLNCFLVPSYWKILRHALDNVTSAEKCLYQENGHNSFDPRKGSYVFVRLKPLLTM